MTSGAISDVRIVDLSNLGPETHRRAAELLVEGFRQHWPDAWPNLDDALEEVREALAPGKVCRAALGDDRDLLGWIGGIPGYDGNVWELHPLVVAPARQGQGVGRALVLDLEQQVRERGALTLWVGSDDEDSMTSLADVDLYEDLPGQLARIENLKGHPFEFYQKCGFTLAGVVPDANGRGKPDILMAKRVDSVVTPASAGRSRYTATG